MDAPLQGSLRLNCLGYADDLVLFFNSMEKAQRNLDVLNSILKKYGLRLNNGKCKYQIISTMKKYILPSAPLVLEGKDLEEVEEYVYLGSVISSRAVDRPDLERRLRLADVRVCCLKSILFNWSLPLRLRYRVLMTFIFPTATYGCETWALKTADEKFARIWWMKILRRMTGTRWFHKRNDLKVLAMVNSKHLTTMIASRRLRYAGHLWRYPSERFARQSIFAEWGLTGSGRLDKKLPRWGLQVSEHLRRHDIQLDLDKEVYQEKLAEIYVQQDLCDLTVGITKLS